MAQPQSIVFMSCNTMIDKVSAIFFWPTGGIDWNQRFRRADIEGLPYQTLLSSVVHKFVTDQLVDKRSILKSMEILKAS
jgi:hypothetical protein